MRKNELVTNQIYHILNKSIAGYKIFNDELQYSRIIELIKYYNNRDVEYKYSRYIELLEKGIDIEVNYVHKSKRYVDIISYCIMPTHLHLSLKQLCDDGVSTFMRKILDSYTRYFNIKHSRKGPLWVGRFKNVLIENNEQLLHLTRYHHLNPVTSNLVEKPEDWPYSSYNEYLGNTKNKICSLNNLLDIDPRTYQKFVNSRRSYQKALSKIKKIVID
ncbi:MAG: hypothetical protein ACD_58C00278G0002 [uncultured bacterium]|nr:MAG: hypothetical protein ACD_58C00278G0002 [uncultured bacterium]